MDNNLNIDYGKLDLKVEGDIYLLSSDGVHDFIDQQTLTEVLQTLRSDQSAQYRADKLVATGLAAMAVMTTCPASWQMFTVSPKKALTISTRN